MRCRLRRRRGGRGWGGRVEGGEFAGRGLLAPDPFRRGVAMCYKGNIFRAPPPAGTVARQGRFAVGSGAVIIEAGLGGGGGPVNLPPLAAPDRRGTLMAHQGKPFNEGAGPVS